MASNYEQHPVWATAMGLLRSLVRTGVIPSVEVRVGDEPDFRPAQVNRDVADEVYEPHGD